MNETFVEVRRLNSDCMQPVNHHGVAEGELKETSVTSHIKHQT